MTLSSLFRSPAPLPTCCSTLLLEKSGQPVATSYFSVPDKRETSSATSGVPRGRQERQAQERGRRRGTEKVSLAGWLSQCKRLVVPFFRVKGEQRQQQGALEGKRDRTPRFTIIFTGVTKHCCVRAAACTYSLVCQRVGGLAAFRFELIPAVTPFPTETKARDMNSLP